MNPETKTPLEEKIKEFKVVSPEDYEMSIEDYDFMTATMVGNDRLKHEKVLFQSKWFDYRFMHPYQATLKYAEEYTPAFRYHYCRAFGYEKGKYFRPLKKSFAELDKAVLTGLWRGRQVADAIGMPYKEFITVAFEKRLRHWKQRYMPRPFHLYGEQQTELVVDRWDEMCRSKLYRSRMPELHNDNYDNLPIQNDHHDWLFEQVDHMASGETTLKNLVVDGWMPIEKIKSRYGQDKYNAVCELFHNPT